MRYDVVVIGSGFGGSVAALRLAEKGYSVAVLEAGRRFEDKDFPKTSWRLRKFLWAPALGLLRHPAHRHAARRSTKGASVLVLSGAGVGGGSLVYANTLYRPLPAFYDDPQWRDIADWRAELAPHYDTAERMLGSGHLRPDDPDGRGHAQGGRADGRRRDASIPRRSASSSARPV